MANEVRARITREEVLFIDALSSYRIDCFECDYQNSDGCEFNLPIHDTELAFVVMSRLKELGVKILKLG